jgi:hypothetical protein
MVRYATNEAASRSERLNANLGQLKEGSTMLGERIREAKERMDVL